MANFFQLNFVPYGDRPGLGAYETGHFLQHQQYLNILAASGIILPDYNILQMGPGPEGQVRGFLGPGEFLGDNPNEFYTWLNVHAAIHDLIRAHSNVNGADLSWFDIRSAEEWYLWQQTHAADHAAFDQHFGTT